MDLGETMNKIARSDDELLDFLSALPESVVHHILSFLPFGDIVRSSVLSKLWYHIWSDYPNINLLLDEENYMDTLPRRPFLDHIERILDQCLLRKVCIQKLQLKLYARNLEELAPVMDGWLRAAIERNVSELVMEMHFGPKIWYSIPKEVAVADSLKVLELEGCKLEDTFCCINLPHLQKFKTLQCQFASENVLSEILCGCPSLEFVEVLVCDGVGSFLSVSSKPKLKYFSMGCVENIKMIEIFAPNLETFKCNVTPPCAIDLASCTLLRYLELDGVTLSADYVPIQNLLSKLVYIQELHLCNCEAADKIRISSSRLKRLVIMSEYRSSFPGAEIDAPDLVSLDFFALGACDSNNQFRFWNVPKVEEIHMVFSDKSFQSARRGGLKGFLMQLQNYEDLKLVIQCKGQRDFIMHEKLHAVSFSSLNKFFKRAKPEYVVISSRRDESFLTHMLVSGGGDVRLSLIFSSHRSIQLLHKKLSNASRLKFWYSEFQLVIIEEIEHEIGSPWKSFMKTHSKGYQTARIVFVRKSLENMFLS